MKTFPGRHFKDSADSTMTIVKRTGLESPGHQGDALSDAAFFTDSSLVDDDHPIEVCMRTCPATRCERVLSSEQVIIVGAGLAGIITAIILRHKVNKLSLKIFDKNSQVVSEISKRRRKTHAPHDFFFGQRMR